MTADEIPPAPTLSFGYQSDHAQQATVLTLTGTQSVSQSQVDTFPVNGLTLSLWLKTEDTNTSAVLFSYDDNADDPSHHLFIGNPANIEVHFGSSGTGPTGVALNDSTWHHLAMTLAPADPAHYAVRLYLDGVVRYHALSAISHDPDKQLETGGFLVLGRNAVGGDEPSLSCMISEFRLWNGERSAAQIVTDMERRVSGETPAPVVYWELASPETSGTLNGTPGFTDSDLMFRTQILQAAWNEITGAQSYTLMVEETDGCWRPMLQGLTVHETAIEDFSVNSAYGAQVQAVKDGIPGLWSDQKNVLVLNLPPVFSRFQADTGTPALSVQWDDVDQAQAYNITIYKNGSTQPDPRSKRQTDRSYDLMPMVTGDDWWSYTIRGNSVDAASLGPATTSTALQAMSLTLVYNGNGVDNGTLDLSWSRVGGSDYVFLSVYRIDGEIRQPVADKLMASSITTDSLAPSMGNGQVYGAHIRAIGPGTIAAWSPEQRVTIHKMTAPVINSATADPAAHTIDVAWSFMPSPPVGAQFTAELFKQGEQAPFLAQTVSQTSCQFHNSDIKDETNFRTRVRAQCDGSFSPWSQWRDVPVNALPEVQGLNATARDNKDVDVNWTNAGIADATYSVYINSPTAVTKTAGADATGITFTASETGVKADNTYTVTIHLEKGGQTGPETSTSVKIKPDGRGHNDTVDDPINTDTGGYAYAHADLSLFNPVPLEFIIQYSTALPSSSENPVFTGKPLGERWTHSYNTRLVRNQDNTRLWVLWGDAKFDTYLIPSSLTGTYAKESPPYGDHLTLGSDMIYTLTTKRQWTYRFTFEGRMESITAPTGNQLTLTYNGSSQLTEVSDPHTGKSFSIAYNGDGRIETVTDNAGRIVRYAYQGADLYTVNDPAGNVRTFAYTGASLIETITDGTQAGTGTTFLRNTFEDILDTKRISFQQDGRAIETHQDYGGRLSYQRQASGGFNYIVANHTDRAGNASVITSVEDTGSTVEKTYQLGGGSIRKVSRGFDGNNNLLSETIYEGSESAYQPGMGNTTGFTYDGNGNMLIRTDPLNRTVSYTYDDRNRVTHYTNELGNSIQYQYEGRNIKTMTDYMGRVTTFEYYDGPIQGLVKSITDVMGNTTSFTYDKGLQKTITKPGGDITTYDYDSVGRCTRETIQGADGTVLRTITYEYWPDSKLKARAVMMSGQSEAEAFVTSYTYDARGNLTAYTDAGGNQFVRHYDANNLLTGIDYPVFQEMNRKTTYTYDRLDNLSGITYSTTLNISEGMQYDQFGRITSFDDPNRNHYTYGYVLQQATDTGTFDLITTEHFPDPDNTAIENITRMEQSDAAGRLIGITDRDGRTTTFSYDTVDDPSTHTTNERITVTLPPACDGETPYTVVSTTDALGRLVSYQGQDGKTTTLSYTVFQDPATRLFCERITRTDPAGYIVEQVKDPLGRIIQVTTGSGETTQTTAYTYDALDRLIEVQNQQPSPADPVVTGYAYAFDTGTKTFTVTINRPGAAEALCVRSYNGLGQLIKETDALNRVRTYHYTPWGGIHTCTDAASRTFEYCYDDAGRYSKTMIQGTADFIALGRDANGNALTTTNQAQQQITRTFDHWNRLSSRTDANGKQVQYAYWPADQLKTLTYSDGKTVSYDYDGLGRLRQITDWAGRTTGYTYNPTGRIAHVDLPNSTTGDFTYDDAGQLTCSSYTHGENIITRISYTLDACGRRRVSNAILPLAPQTLVTSIDAVYDAADQAIQYNRHDLGRDANGNLLTCPWDGAFKTVGYDHFNRVTSIGEDTYGYDMEGLRDTATINGEEYRYVYDVGDYRDPVLSQPEAGYAVTHTALSETPSGALALTPLPAVTSWTAPVASSRPALQAAARFEQDMNALDRSLDRILEIGDANGAILYRHVFGHGLIGCEDAQGGFLVHHYDSRGSTLALTNEQGFITDRYAYGVYNRIENRMGSSFNPFRYNGRDGVLDDGNGLLSMRARSYAPDLMGFVQRDFLFGRLENPQSLNRYAYARNNPVSLIDPLGLSGARDFFIGLGIVAGIALVAVGIGAAVYYLGPAFVEGLALSAGETVAGGLSTGLFRGAARSFGQFVGRRFAREVVRKFLERNFPQVIGYGRVLTIELETFGPESVLSEGSELLTFRGKSETITLSEDPRLPVESSGLRRRIIPLGYGKY
jgi:RHS repeat-associated protein